MLRYFLRVEATYGASQASASLAAREATHCYAYVLGSLGDQLPGAEQSAISALDDADPELVLDAARALERQGSAGAEGALWARLRRFRQEWTGREDQLRRTPDHEGAESRAVAVEEALVSAIAKGHGWICGSDKLARLAGLASTERQRREIDRWIGYWNQPTALIQTFWSARRDPAFSLLQYDGLTEARLRTKLAQLPRGKRLAWQFWPQHPAMVSMTVQEACYARMRAVAGKHGLTLDKAGNP